MMRFSIVIPVYNVEKYIRKCLQSICNQTLKDWECVVVDDGSTDSSGKVLDEFARCDSRFRVIHQENQGQCGARNVGLDAMSPDSRYFFLLDSDDYVAPDFIEHLYGLIKDKPYGYVGACNWQQFDEENPCFGVNNLSAQLDEYSPIPPLVSLKTGPMWNKIWPKSALIVNDIPLRFDKRVRYSEDIVYLERIMANVKGIVIDRTYVGYYYRSLPFSVSNGRSPLYVAVGFWHGSISLYETLGKTVDKARFKIFVAEGAVGHALDILSWEDARDYVNEVEQYREYRSVWAEYVLGESVDARASSRLHIKRARMFAFVFSHFSGRQAALLILICNRLAWFVDGVYRRVLKRWFVKRRQS